MSDTTTDAPTTPAEPTNQDAQDVSSLPQWARDQLADARKDAAKYRTKLREAEPLAKQAQELLDAQKTTEQRLAEQVADAQRAAETARAEALRYRIATRYGISDADADLYLTATDEDLLERQAKGLAERAATPGVTPGPRPDLSQGKTSDVPLNSDALLDTVKSKLGIT